LGKEGKITRFDGLAEDILRSIPKGIWVLYLLQLLASGIALAVLIWDSVSYVKNRLIYPEDLYPWTYTFYNPTDSGVYNYFTLCLILGLLCICTYFIINSTRSRSLLKRLESIPPVVIISTVSLSMIGLAIALMHVYERASFLIYVSLVIIPLLELFYALFNYGERFRIELISIGVFVTAAWLIAIIDLGRIIVGPVYLMNEFPEIYSKTILRSGTQYTVDNLDFLKKYEHKIDIPTLYTFLGALDNSKTEPDANIKDKVYDLFGKYEYRNLRAAQSFMNEVGRSPGSAEYLLGNRFSPTLLKKMNLVSTDFFYKLRQFDVEEIKQFYTRNLWEYSHLNMGRGQLNHIGHILNPINEYELGKPVRDIYLQYGLGNTLLFKWIMDRFGGISIHNYYKIYALYLVYYLSFIILLVYLFKDGFYVLAASMAPLLSFFFLGYFALILGPGIIPSIHLFDALVLIFLAVFMRRGNMAGLLIATVLTFLSIAINRQFGAALTLAFLATMSLFSMENKTGTKRILWLSGLAASAVIAGIVLAAASTFSSSEVFSYFLGGFFSWKPNELIVMCTFLYLIVSYLFFFVLRSDRSDLKYAYVFVFVYSQGLMVYYYWSGLTNHFHPISHFMFLQAFLMLFILKRSGNRFIRSEKNIPDRLGMAIALVATLIVLPFSIYNYSNEKAGFIANFKNHRIYQWELDRAAVLSTADPEMIARSVSLIRKYSPESSPGVFILSKHDNILPFLAHRYSAMPIFELSSYLFSRKERDIAVARIRDRKPEYLFVDTNIDGFRKDPWESVYFGSFMENERLSRLGRYAVMADIFHQVKADYYKIEQECLLSVYKRKATRIPAY